MNVAEPRRLIPVAVITGYLGCGKTTLLNHVLKHVSFANSVVVVNEFGEIGLDHLLIATPTENTVLLEGGCLCCEMRGDFVDTLARLHEDASSGKIKQFDRVVIETTGLADPVPILQTVVTDTRLSSIFCLDRVITMIDGQHGWAHLDRYPESSKQLAIADCLVLSKSDLITESAKARFISRLKEINPGAGQFFSIRGQVDTDGLFGLKPDNQEARLAAALRWINSAAYDNGHTHDTKDGVQEHSRHINSFSFYLDGEIRSDGLMLWLSLLAALKSANILRLKAIFNVEGRPVVIQVVQAIVYEPFTLDCWPDAERRSRIVVIGQDLRRADIERTFSAFQFEAGPKPATGGIDPMAYTRFLEVAGLVDGAAPCSRQHLN